MQTKLTLRIDGELVCRAKIFAGKHSKTVAGYFALLGDADGEETDRITPVVRSLKGVLGESNSDFEDYHRYLKKNT
ncbi:antitoxin [candidate division KSB1 bacterium]|nr:antitoxin [candidate division KSB1 bacterium]NIR71465.1 antitoxin [candidate division KSB1 bacterium]NIS23386.1 antitoxin [candidate division KSB1 bacterium]NIT70277.1 antitoxin [candidate division KSB1 bacterium]NIU24000.1 antitoxin [candidate division KSB1 bacterium]